MDAKAAAETTKQLLQDPFTRQLVISVGMFVGFIYVIRNHPDELKI